MERHQLESLTLYVDVSKRMHDMSDKFASIGIFLEDADENCPRKVQNDFEAIICTLDKHIVKVLSLEEEYDAERFFKMVSDYLNGKTEKKETINTIRDYIDNLKWFAILNLQGVTDRWLLLIKNLNRKI